MKRIFFILSIAFLSGMVCFAGSNKPTKLAKLIYFDGPVVKKKPVGHGRLILDRSMVDKSANYRIEGDFSDDKISNAVFYLNGEPSEGKITGDFIYTIDEKESSIALTLDDVTFSDFENNYGIDSLEHINLGLVVMGKYRSSAGYKWGMGFLQDNRNSINTQLPYTKYPQGLVKLVGNAVCTRNAVVEIIRYEGKQFFKLGQVIFTPGIYRFSNGATYKSSEVEKDVYTSPDSDVLYIMFDNKKIVLKDNSTIHLKDKSKLTLTNWKVQNVLWGDDTRRGKWDVHVNGEIAFADGAKFNGTILLSQISNGEDGWGMSIYNTLKSLNGDDVVLYTGQYTESSGKTHEIAGLPTEVAVLRGGMEYFIKEPSDTIFREEYIQGVPAKYQGYVAKAIGGDPDAQTKLGICFNNGDGVAVDYRKANYWLRKAALNGNPDAQNRLAINLEDGNGTKKNPQEAILWYKKAAEQGYVKAQYNLAVNYSNGYGVAKDNKIAAMWYQRAAEQGDAASQNNLGVYYELGLGVEKDWEKARYWYEKAATQGYGQAQYNLGLYYYGGHEFNDAKALYWYKKAAAQGVRDSKDKVAMIEHDISESKKPVKYRRCTSCNGTGICSTCSGKGWFIHPMNNEYMKCGFCFYTGRCSTCSGTGKEAYR